MKSAPTPKLRERPGPPPNYCSKCGMDEEESLWGKLIDITVETSRGEEGHATVEMLLCDMCYPEVNEAVMKLGFVNHHHGGIDFLEDGTCEGGYANCPTPTGPHIVLGNPHLSKPA